MTSVSLIRLDWHMVRMIHKKSLPQTGFLTAKDGGDAETCVDSAGETDSFMETVLLLPQLRYGN